MSTNLKGKAIAVTGAASGIGRATAKMLAERGAILAIADLNGEALETVVSELKSSGAVVTGTGIYPFSLTLSILNQNDVDSKE
jgi:NAD(P)-dependent dehydrogenase (short-subunit alcohol dehydrogenase family)